MKNFIIILTIFFTLFIIVSLYLNDYLWIFLSLFLGFLIALICLITYLGIIRGFFLAVFLSALPFVFEFFGLKYHLPYFSTRFFTEMSWHKINLAYTTYNLFYLVTIPLIFICALFFGQKIKLYYDVKKYHKTVLIFVSSLLVAMEFLVFSPVKIDYTGFVKWLLISLAVYTLLKIFINFKAETPEIYKELPIIIFLAIYGLNALKTNNPVNLTIGGLLVGFYLIILYNEYKIRKISQTF